MNLFESNGVYSLSHVAAMDRKDGKQGTYLCFNKGGYSLKYFGWGIPYTEELKKMVGNRYDLTGCFVHTEFIPETQDGKVKMSPAGVPYMEARVEEVREKFVEAWSKPQVNWMAKALLGK